MLRCRYVNIKNGGEVCGAIVAEASKKRQVWSCRRFPRIRADQAWGWNKLAASDLRISAKSAANHLREPHWYRSLRGCDEVFLVFGRLYPAAGSITIGMVGVWLPPAGSMVTAKPFAITPVDILWNIMPLPLPSGLNQPAGMGALPSAGSSQS
jgi:hypothetical protein